jgi:hypothetical protein
MPATLWVMAVGLAFAQDLDAFPDQPRPGWFPPRIKAQNQWHARSVVAYCCTNCGLLKFVALKLVVLSKR